MNWSCLFDKATLETNKSCFQKTDSSSGYELKPSLQVNNTLIGWANMIVIN